MTASVFAPTGDATQGSEAAMYCNNLNAHLPRDQASSVSGMTPMCAAASEAASVPSLQGMGSMLISGHCGKREQITRSLISGCLAVRRAKAANHR